MIDSYGTVYYASFPPPCDFYYLTFTGVSVVAAAELLIEADGVKNKSASSSCDMAADVFDSGMCRLCQC